MMAGSAAEEENHWPGYVDALTTMTMMLIFVMTILAIAIFGLSQNVSRSMVEKIAKAANIDNVESSESTEDLASRVMARLEVKTRDTMIAKAEPPPPEVMQEPAHQMASTTAATKEQVQPASVKESSAFITVAFQKRATGVDDETNARIKAVMADGGHLSKGVEIKAYADKAGAISDSRRVAFYRLLNLRNQLIAMGVPADRIKARIEDALNQDSTDLVRIDLAKAG
jgi:hypothetical protein